MVHVGWAIGLFNLSRFAGSCHLKVGQESPGEFSGSFAASLDQLGIGFPQFSA